MTDTRFIEALAAITIAIAPAAAFAEDLSAADQPGIEFELGVGGNMAPAYEGASQHLLSPVPLFKLNRLVLPNGTVIGGEQKTGFSFGPAFNIIGERDSSEYEDIKGLRDIDMAVELGLKLRYKTDGLRAYGEIRRGFGGHEGVVGEIGIDFVARPDTALELHAGPRLHFADGEYMQTYFGVNGAEAGRTGFKTHNPGGGIKSYGAQAGARLDIGENWAFTGRVNYERLVNDAADSPVVKNGSPNQFSARIGIVRKLRIGF